MTMIEGNMAAGGQAWHSSITNWELIASSQAQSRGREGAEW